MARATARAVGTSIVERMETLAHFITQMESDEIWALLDALFPGLSEDKKEDLFGRIIAAQANGEPLEGRPAEDVFADLERERGLQG